MARNPCCSPCVHQPYVPNFLEWGLLKNCPLRPTNYWHFQTFQHFLMYTVSSWQLFTFWGSTKIFCKTAWAKAGISLIYRNWDFQLLWSHVRETQSKGNPKLLWPAQTWLWLKGLIFGSAFGKGVKQEGKIDIWETKIVYFVCFNEEIWCIFLPWLVSSRIQLHRFVEHSLDLQPWVLNILIIKSPLGLISS